MGVIYKKTCSDTGQIYYGKFEDTWERRIKRGWEDCSCRDFVNPTVEFLEIDVPNDKLKEKEDYYIQNFECVNIRGKYTNLTLQEYHKQNCEKTKEHKKEYDRQYNIDNKEKKSIRGKKYYNDTIEHQREKKKIYYANNIDKIKERYAKNKEKRKETKACNNCGSVVRIDTMNRHQRSKKCMNFIKH